MVRFGALGDRSAFGQRFSTGQPGRRAPAFGARHPRPCGHRLDGGVRQPVLHGACSTPCRIATGGHMKELSLSAVRHPFLDFGGTINAQESRALSPSTSSGRRLSKGTGFDSPERVNGPHATALAYAATESRSPVIFLNAGRVSLLALAREEARRVVLVTDELSLLTPAFAEVWREAGAAWVVRSQNGLREGFSGRRLVHIGEVFTASAIRSVDDVDLDFLRPVPATSVQIMA